MMIIIHQKKTGQKDIIIPQQIHYTPEPHIHPI